MKNIEKYNIQELNTFETQEINGGGEGYAYWFGWAVTTGAATVLLPGIGALAIAIYDYNNTP